MSNKTVEMYSTHSLCLTECISGIEDENKNLQLDTKKYSEKQIAQKGEEE